MSKKVIFKLRDKRSLNKEYNTLHSFIEREFNALDNNLQDEIINSTDVGIYNSLGNKRHVFFMYVNSIVNYTTKGSMEIEYNYFKSLSDSEKEELYKGVNFKLIRDFEDFLIYFNYDVNCDIASIGMINYYYNPFNHIELNHVVHNAMTKYAMSKLENKELSKFSTFDFISDNNLGVIYINN